MRMIYPLCTVLTRRPEAAAFLNGSEKYKEIRGQVFFYELVDSVLVRAEVSGLPKASISADFRHFYLLYHRIKISLNGNTRP